VRDTGNHFREVLNIVALYSKYTRALTFEKLCKQKQSNVGPVQASVQAERRSELLNYKEQAIERERKKQLRKESAVKVQNFFRRWLRRRAISAPSQAQAKAAAKGKLASGDFAAASADADDDWQGFRVVESEPHHFRSPQLSPISQTQRNNRTNEVFDHDAALQPPYCVGKSPPIVTHANAHYFGGSDSRSRSPPIITLANQQLFRSPSTSSPDDRRLTPPNDLRHTPSYNPRTASPLIRPVRRESPLPTFPISQQQHQRLRAVILGHRVRRHKFSKVSL